ncbi:MAG: hypothetical protein KF744_12330 [Taibaiella sp.]|nr:hypothetical protein [Taibaiella sp.]
MRKTATPDNPYLELTMTGGRFQLATREAYYSDGDKYEPAIAVCKHFSAALPAFRNALVLGTGLGSIVEVMRSKGGNPEFTLVEKDKTVLKWAMELSASDARMIPVCEDAADFIQRDDQQYDFIFIDIFFGRHVPEFVTSTSFLKAVKARQSLNGRLAMNYIVNDPGDWNAFCHNFAAVFPEHKIIESRDNRIFVV